MKLRFLLTILLEQEVKFRLPAAEDGAAELEAMGAHVEKPRHFEQNVLYDYPDRRLAKRDEALRLRRAGDQSWLTWKGPHHGSGRIKQRREFESFLSDADAVEAVLEALGLVECFRYEKYRAIYRAESAVLTIDETPMGVFLEIEATPVIIAEMAGRLGLDMKDAINLSYPHLYELYRDTTPGTPEFMVFPEDPSTKS